MSRLVQMIVMFVLRRRCSSIERRSALLLSIQWMSSKMSSTGTFLVTVDKMSSVLASAAR